MTASQESTLDSYTAEYCIDGNGNSLCHGHSGHDVWFEMTFEEVFCIDTVKIVAYKTDGAQHRMDKGKILVVNSSSGEETLCGVLRTRDGQNQVYNVECRKYVCGNKVKFSVIRTLNEYVGNIAMREITAYYSTGM